MLEPTLLILESLTPMVLIKKLTLTMLWVRIFMMRTVKKPITAQ